MRFTFIAIMLLPLVPLLMGNKGCPTDQYPIHPKIESSSACAACHDDGRTMKTRPEGHNLEWKKDHGQFVSRFGMKANSYCALCHTESSCAVCHQQESPVDHNDFFRLKGHGINAGLDRTRCYACHRSDFCQRCHASTQPLSHTGSWGAASNQHCLNCHFPLAAAGAQQCAACHTGTPSHTTATPTIPSNANHGSGAVCRNCHIPVPHADNGQACTACHSR